MYTKFFELDVLPFEGLPDKRFYFVGEAQHQALNLLTENLSRNGSICILTGASGSGKTTLVRMLIRSLPTRMRIIAIDDPRLDAHMLLATILRASGVMATSFESIAELTLKLRLFLENSMRSGVLTTVICDEAQGLSDEVIEQIRLISNIEGELGKMINFLLVGQEDLIRHIQTPEHQMFWGRVKAFAALPKLNQNEVQAYVSFRLQQAGCHKPVFTKNAIATLTALTDGVMRLINSIADRALDLAAADHRPQVTSRLVKKAEKIVRHRRGILVEGASSLGFYLLRLCCKQLPMVLLGAGLAVGVFAACYFYLPQTITSPALSAVVAQDETVRSAYDQYIRSILGARLERQKSRYEVAVGRSLFKGDAVDTLIKVWGYARRDGEQNSCALLSPLGLECAIEQNELDSLEKANRPAVLSLRDDNLNPFYAVLLHLDDNRAELMLDGHIFTVKTAYLRKIYDGEYLAVRYALHANPVEFEDAEVALFAKALHKDEEMPGKLSRRRLKELLEKFSDNYELEEQAAWEFDRLFEGPRLEF
ncbi:MAG: AAA family ATPase [Succinivibrio sp.]|nr:AAA family ATPase [Succinivibrio sp.]